MDTHIFLKRDAAISIMDSIEKFRKEISRGRGREFSSERYIYAADIQKTGIETILDELYSVVGEMLVKDAKSHNVFSNLPKVLCLDPSVCIGATGKELLENLSQYIKKHGHPPALYAKDIHVSSRGGGSKMMLNKIICGDCLEVMKNIPDGSIDMVLSDLPYGVTSRNSWDSIIPFDKLWEQYKRVTKKNAAIVLTATQPFASQLISSN